MRGRLLGGKMLVRAQGWKEMKEDALWGLMQKKIPLREAEKQREGEG